VGPWSPRRSVLGVHLAVYFPGGSIPGQDPFDDRLAWITMRALEHAGAFVVPVRYDDDVLEQDGARFESGVRRELRGALAHHEPTRLTIVGKSRGTFALQIACAEQLTYPDDTRMIWLTPVWRSDEAWRAACANTIESLHVVGLADREYHDPDRHAAVPGETVTIVGADHRLEVAGDVFATLDAWRMMANAVVRFAGRT
jgi:hypothetical protein